MKVVNKYLGEAKKRKETKEIIEINNFAGQMIVEFEKAYPEYKRGDPKAANLHKTLKKLRNDISDRLYLLKQHFDL